MKRAQRNKTQTTKSRETDQGMSVKSPKSVPIVGRETDTTVMSIDAKKMQMHKHKNIKLISRCVPVCAGAVCACAGVVCACAGVCVCAGVCSVGVGALAWDGAVSVLVIAVVVVVVCAVAAVVIIGLIVASVVLCVFFIVAEMLVCYMFAHGCVLCLHELKQTYNQNHR